MKVWRRRATLTALGVLLLGWLVWTPAVFAQDPFLGWRSLETEHFIIHYHEHQGDLPQRVALYCEQSHLILSPLMDWQPAQRTHVVLDDRTDTANGSAGVVPRNVIRLFATAPQARSNLGDYDDWLRGLILHEYAHIIHIDNVGGLSVWLNELFGKANAPNQLLPRWYTEGFATYQESARTGGGRSRSSHFHMLLRAAWLQDKLFDLGEIAGAPQQWPRGASWYLYGSHFLTWVAEVHGEDVFRRFHDLYGARYIPYSMNSTLREVMGEGFVELYQQWRAHLEGKLMAQTMALRLRGVVQPERVTLAGNVHEAPRPRAGHRQVSYFAANGLEQGGLYLHDLETGQHRRLVKVYSGGGPHAWDPTGRYVVMHNRQFWRNTYSYNDLLLIDTQTHRRRRLTQGARARDPDFDPEGRRVVYVRGRAGATDLVLYHIEEDRHEVLVEGTALGVFDTPRYSPDGRFIAVSWWPDGRGRDIYLWDTHKQRLLQVTADEALDIEPSFSPDGRHLLFSSDRSGIYDIYMLELDGLAARADAAPGQQTVQLRLPSRRLTRVLTGAFTPQVVQDQGQSWLYVALYGADGYDLARMPFVPERALSRHTERKPRPVVRWPQVSQPEAPDQPYQPWRFLGPLGISPLTAYSTTGRGSWGVEMFGQDPVGLHFWSFVGEYLPETEDAYASGSYTFLNWPINVALAGQYTTYERTRSRVVASDYVPFRERSWDGQLSLSLPVRSPEATHRLSLAYNLRWTEDAEPRVDPPPNPDDISPREAFQGNFSSVVLGYSVSDTDRFANSISAEDGYSLGLSLRLRDHWTGASVKSMQVTGDGSLFLPNPLLDNHTLRLTGRAGFGRSDYRGREIFSVGGVPPQQTVTALINLLPQGGAWLRGFEPGALRGEQYYLGTAEYRMPVYDVEMGFDTLPFRLGRLMLAGFSDYGTAFNGAFEEANFHLGAGAELRLSVTLGFAVPASFRLGYAHGFGKLGMDDVYFYFGNFF